MSFISAGLDHWEVVCNGGDGFVTEETPAGCKQICECTSAKGESRKLFDIAVVLIHVNTCIIQMLKLFNSLGCS